MDKENFEALVLRALNNLPQEFSSKLDNIDIVVQDWPSPEQLKEVKAGHATSLLGLYEGVPQTRRTHGYNLVLPDKITIFQKPIENRCRLNEEIEREIGRVILHEIAHHFGISDATLRIIEHDKRH